MTKIYRIKIEDPFDVAFAATFAVIMAYFLLLFGAKLVTEDYTSEDVREICLTHGGVQDIVDGGSFLTLRGAIHVICKDGRFERVDN